MLLESEVAPHRGLPCVLRLEVFDLDNQPFTFLFVLIFQGDDLIVVSAHGSAQPSLSHHEKTHPAAQT